MEMRLSSRHWLITTGLIWFYGIGIIVFHDRQRLPFSVVIKTRTFPRFTGPRLLTWSGFRQIWLYMAPQKIGALFVGKPYRTMVKTFTARNYWKQIYFLSSTKDGWLIVISSVSYKSLWSSVCSSVCRSVRLLDVLICINSWHTVSLEHILF